MSKRGKTKKQLGLPMGINGETRTRKGIKTSEAQSRAEIKLYTDKAIATLPLLPILPTRWELLKRDADKKNVPLKPLIQPVHEAIREVEKALEWIEHTRGGNLFVLNGETGSGKTTFFNSLVFFLRSETVAVETIKLRRIDSAETVEDKLALLDRKPDKYSIVILEGKEQPGSLTSQEIDILLTTINTDSRTDTGFKTLFVIPTTSPILAQQIAERAAAIGGMTSGREKRFFVFGGPQRREYYAITNDTVRALNDSRSLSDFGISEEKGNGLSESANTIGQFMQSCLQELTRQREALSKAIHSLNGIKRKRIHLWVIFCSLEDQSRSNHDLVRALTLDDTQHVQINRILKGESEPVRFWQNKKTAFAQTAQYLDLRIAYLPVRTANTVMEAYGDQEFIEELKGKGLIKRTETKENAQASLANTAIGAFLHKKGFTADPPKRGPLQDNDKKVFEELVKLSFNDDKIVNAALAQALREWNTDPDIIVGTEVPLNDSKSLIADIAWVTPTDIYCLELKWRSSVLNTSEIIRETAGRAREYAQELPELKSLLGSLES